MYVPGGQLFSIASERPLDSFPNSHNTYLLQYTNSFSAQAKGKRIRPASSRRGYYNGFEMISVIAFGVV